MGHTGEPRVIRTELRVDESHARTPRRVRGQQIEQDVAREHALTAASLTGDLRVRNVLRLAAESLDQVQVEDFTVVLLLTDQEAPVRDWRRVRQPASAP
jgi:hypothetical protein